jgi:hypothetical protein
MNFLIRALLNGQRTKAVSRAMELLESEPGSSIPVYHTLKATETDHV